MKKNKNYKRYGKKYNLWKNIKTIDDYFQKMYLFRFFLEIMKIIEEYRKSELPFRREKMCIRKEIQIILPHHAAAADRRKLIHMCA